MPSSYTKERIMLICWSWRDLELKKRIVNNALLNESFYKRNLNRVESFKDDLFDEYAVCDRLPDGTKPEVSPKAIVVRTYLIQELHNLESVSFQYLKNLVEWYKTAENELFVFLHRRDGFSDVEVGAILNMTRADKCFLIGGGTDHIYYRGFRNQGILGDDGRFFRSIPEKDKPAVTVADDQVKKIFQPHFDKTWDYYRHEFYTKIFELKEDLLTFFYAIYPDNEPWNGEDMVQRFFDNDCLRLRINSFIDHSDHQLTKDESGRLKEYGYKAEKSYEFDDCRKNLVGAHQLEDEFEEVASFLAELFFSESARQKRQDSINDVLRTINSHFSSLLAGIKPK